jgi:LacI family transcriptional regulator
MPVTIKQVAQAAAVSTSTVSHVINGTHHVSPELTARVMKAIDEFGYQMNPIARSLAKGTTQVIGLLAPEIGSSYAGEIIRGIDDELAEHGYHLMLFTTRRRTPKMSAYVEALTKGLVDGLLILVPGKTEDYLKPIAQQNYPHVMIDYQADGSVTSSVGASNWQGAYQATNYLIELGHQRVGFVTGEMILGCSATRLAAYKQALLDAGLPFNPSLVCEGDFTQLSGHEAGEYFLQLDAPPTAVFASNDQMAFGVADAIRNHGLRIPQDISLIGFDDIKEAEAMRPALTTVRQPLREMGRVAVDMLIKRIKEPLRPGYRIELETTLILRDTCQAVVSKK